MEGKMNEPRGSPGTHTRRSSLLEIIFGQQISDVINEQNKLPEATLAKAIDFKIEQEKTKQQYYKLANMDKCLDLLKFAKEYGIPPQHLIHLINNNDTPSNNTTITAANHQETHTHSNTSNTIGNEPYKFPPPTDASKSTTTNNNNSTVSTSTIGTDRRTFHRRTNSPARIGANAVAALSDSLTIKEEDASDIESPLKNKFPVTINNNRSNNNSHNRNMSLPTMNKFLSPSVPTNMTSILNFEDNNSTKIDQPHPKSARNSPVNNKRAPHIIINTGNNNSNVNDNTDNSPKRAELPLVTDTNNFLKRPFPVRSSSGNSIQKKMHRRARSTTVIPSFGVIDLNVIDQQASQNKGPSLSNINNNINDSGNNNTSNANNDTCSESSSTKGNDSPMKLPLYQHQLQPPHKFQNTNSVTRLLNDC